jgi:hypothetical protein
MKHALEKPITLIAVVKTNFITLVEQQGNGEL